jgi:hypothetical protein
VGDLSGSTAVSFPAGSVHVSPSSGEITDHDQALTSLGNVWPEPAQNGVPHRDVQLKSAGDLSALSIV